MLIINKNPHRVITLIRKINLHKASKYIILTIMFILPSKRNKIISDLFLLTGYINISLKLMNLNDYSSKTLI